MLEWRIEARTLPTFIVLDLEITFLEELNSILQSLIDYTIASMENSRAEVLTVWGDNSPY